MHLETYSLSLVAGNDFHVCINVQYLHGLIVHMLFSMSIVALRDNAFWNWFTYDYLTAWLLMIFAICFHCIVILYSKMQIFASVTSAADKKGQDISTTNDFFDELRWTTKENIATSI